MRQTSQMETLCRIRIEQHFVPGVVLSEHVSRTKPDLIQRQTQCWSDSTMTIVCHARLAVCPCEYLDLDGDQLQSNLFEWDHTDCLTIKFPLSWPESYL